MELLEKDHIFCHLFFYFSSKRAGCSIKIPFKQTGAFIMLQRICSLFGVYYVLYSPKSCFNIAVNLIIRDEI